MKYAPAELEIWMRDYYFAVDDDIGSSGVADYSLADLRELLGFSSADLDAIVLRDSMSLGGDEVRAAIADRWGDGDPHKVMVTHGASEAIYLVMSTLLDPGDRVVVLDPVYHSLASTARTLGCELVPWEINAADGYRPDLGALRALVAEPTKAIVVNLPHNPTGTSVTAAERDELVAIARSAGAYLIWDQAFREMVHAGEPLRDPINDYDRAVSFGTLSKGYGLAGLRVGWCLAHPDVLDGVLDLRDRTTLHLSPLVEFLAARVARGADRLLAPRLDQARRNLVVLRQWADDNPELVDLVTPMGGVSTFPRLVGIDDTTALCHRLAQEHRVLLVPGSCFGDPQRVRLGFGGPAASLERGLDRLAGVLREERSLQHVAG
ncbi:capreomycidine synthase [Actinomadura darangshiensis]|uniref:Capreomycidine synthase n=1 Tax=Actinomadura darangshiensis TaxID=705336 RepID=A0A4R5BEA0_9ACTN|nr:capreomycidine synthase [Actinomadura darangshiensis]TDD83150.1 capreomycidine synthase [Actinomadura darangshiensis]